MAETITPPKMTDASTQLQGILSDLYSASNSSTQTPKYWNIKGTQINTRLCSRGKSGFYSFIRLSLCGRAYSTIFL